MGAVFLVYSSNTLDFQKSDLIVQELFFSLT